jgi:hypothetical protein
MKALQGTQKVFESEERRPRKFSLDFEALEK